MTGDQKAIEIKLPAGGFDRSAAVSAVVASRTPEELLSLAPGPFGYSSVGTAVLESLVDAVDLGLAAHAILKGVILSELSEPASFEMGELQPGHHRLLTAFQIVVTADYALRRIAERCPAPVVEGGFEFDGLDDLLDEREPENIARRIMSLGRSYLERKAQALRPEEEPDRYAGTTLAAALQLLRNAVVQFARTGRLRVLERALATRRMHVAGYPYRGFKQEAPTDTPAGLLPIWPEHIVGNDAYLEAGLRLARDVAGFDLALSKNPKKLNPILFGLGSPGSGKTVSAHAIGNYFIRHCREREVPARFVVVRRSDWASSYQNASAANLIRIFREEVYGFDGVCGVYWPDIDTAFASRASDNLRMEEKQNLGAVFGIFDGTLLPKDGKWFLICDANTLNMDEATISRIAQNPHTVPGPTTVAHYVKMIRELMLKDQKTFLPQDEAAWSRIGELAVDQKLTGRAIESVCSNVRATIQDFEYPDDYFKSGPEERQKIFAALSRPVDEAFIQKAMNDWIAFKQEADERAERERFEAEVQAVIRQLNAGQVAIERAASLGIGSSPSGEGRGSGNTT